MSADPFTERRADAIKQWGGLIADYQAVRMQFFVAQAVEDANAGATDVDTKKFEAAFRARQQSWVYEPWNQTKLPAEAVGDTVSIARKLQAKASVRAKSDDNFVAVAVPTAAQLAWQGAEVGAMITFGMQTYGLLPVGTHKKPPPATVFDPEALDTDAWVKAAKSFGAKYAVLVASHRSGFALWPTKSHGYSVAASPWRKGKGDVVADFIGSCRRFGLKPGLFWTQRFNDYLGVANGGLVNASRAVEPVSQAQYDAMMRTQLTELAGYGNTSEVWTNGAIEGPSASELTTQLARLFPTATCHQCPDAYPFGQSAKD